MNDAKVIVTLVDPSLEETQFVFDQPQLCLVGREINCDIALPSDRAHREISRHHCLLDIHPPQARVRDLNSRNGTYLNGKLLYTGAEDFSGEDPEDRAALLKDGDEIRVAGSILRIRIEGAAERRPAGPGRADRRADRLWQYASGA